MKAQEKINFKNKNNRVILDNNDHYIQNTYNSSFRSNLSNNDNGKILTKEKNENEVYCNYNDSNIHNNEDDYNYNYRGGSSGSFIKFSQSFNNNKENGFELILQNSLKFQEAKNEDDENQIQVNINRLRASGSMNFKLNDFDNDDDLLSNLHDNNKQNELSELLVKTILTKKYKYYGQTESNDRSGFGTCWFTNGSSYIGEWKNNKQNGFGKFFKDHNIYEGEFKNSKPDGYIRFITPTGLIIQGLMKNFCFEKDTPIIINSSSQISEIILQKDLNTLTYRNELSGKKLEDGSIEECEYLKYINKSKEDIGREKSLYSSYKDDEQNFSNNRASNGSYWNRQFRESQNIISLQSKKFRASSENYEEKDIDFTPEKMLNQKMNEEKFDCENVDEIEYHETCNCVIGIGKIFNKDKSYYEGYIINNYQDREGIFIKDNIVYKGRKVDRKYYGYCEITYRDGTKFFGNFHSNKKSGIGCFISNDKLLNLAFYTENVKNGGSITRKCELNNQNEIFIYENYHHGFRSNRLESKNSINNYIEHYYPEQVKLLEIDYNLLTNLLINKYK